MSKYPRASKSNLSVECILLFHRLKCIVESDAFQTKPNVPWNDVKNALEDITISYSTNNKKIHIPDGVADNTILLNAHYPLGRNFAKFLRHSDAHNYVSYDSQDKQLSIILPCRGNKGLKMNCKISVECLTKIVELYDKWYNKSKSKNDD